ncbi:methyltransferase domain-containing protein [Methylocystis sp. B8]|uniref:methyltransferase domain-containing protein n=1 Tax=Methylocystis sp. B8 TaxID=544938 RepID=UPI0010FDB487|nr:methyltransferase domain-containing protein [Methylocystis sp. B8]TLG77610.1 class I SAM-dependent methyltransferase [Methylocystis sp. B8]
MTSEAGKSLPNRAIGLRVRNCESCHGNDLEQLWRQSFTARTRLGQYRFDVNNVICRNCGFVFVSPVFDEADLADYYAGSFSAFAGAAPDYDVAKRLAFLDNVVPRGDLFIEVGANRPTEFHRRLKEIYGKVTTVEINDSVSSDHRSLATIPDAGADVVAHYFVLEHIPQVMKFLKECARMLRDGGMMICEVPDILMYPQDPSALQLYEHTNHFSREALRELAEQVGFVEISVSAEYCSRSFGFAAAFRKSVPHDARVSQATGQYRRNRELFLGGVRNLERSEAEMDHSYKTFQTYQDRGSSVVLWAANDLMARFLGRCSCLDNATIVDSNPEKASVFSPLMVFTPDAAADQIRCAKAIFIFTNFHAADILRQIEGSLGKTFDKGAVHVVDPSSDGSRGFVDRPSLRDGLGETRA